jgi:hypothetical protein
MMDCVRALNHLGIDQLRAYLAQLRAGEPADPPWRLLSDPSCTFELSVQPTVDRRVFGSRWSLGQYLMERLALLPGHEVDNNPGLWAWLSLYYFDQVCPANPRRMPGQDYRHVPDFTFRHRYRHLLYGPYAVYRRHRGHAVLLLAGPLHREQKLYHEITSRIDLIASQGVVDAVNSLYFDRKKGGPKRGVQSEFHPGTLRRFVQILQQLDVTYDIYGMTGDEILDLLPPEFDSWREGQRLAF